MLSLLKWILTLLCCVQHHPRLKIVTSYWSLWVYLSSRYDLFTIECICSICTVMIMFLSPSFPHFMHFHCYLTTLPPRVLCSRLQGTLRHCVPSWWGRGLWTLWHQRTWTLCHLEQILSFASWMPVKTGKNSAIHVMLKWFVLEFFSCFSLTF